jgi:signal transduction histidine kinase
MTVDDPLERWRAIQQYIPYGGLTIGAVLTVFVRDDDWPPVWLALGLAVATALFVRHAPGRPAYFAGWTVLAAALVVCSPWNGFAAFVGYLFALEWLFGRWRFAGIAVTAMLIAVSQIGGLPPLTGSGLGIWAAVWLVNCALAGGFSYYGWLTDEQNAARKETIEQLAETNARLAAALAENAELQAQLLASARSAGMHDERERLAREIHDTIAQDLTGLVLLTQRARRELGAAPQLAALEDGLRDTLAETRALVAATAPVALGDGGLLPALTRLAERMTRDTGIRVTVSSDGPIAVDREGEVVLLRCAQEALANVRKHSGASTAQIAVGRLGADVVLTVIDDGRGFDPSAPAAGYGLEGMRERVALVGGGFEIDSSPGTTRLRITTPAAVVA